MFKTRLLLLSLFWVTLLQAQDAYEKEFITLVNEKVKDGNISSISKVACQKGDCRIDDLVLINTDMETGEKSKTSIASFKLKEVKNFIEFKERRGVLKEGEKRQYSIALNDIQSDGHNLFFDKEKMALELGEKSELYRYFKKYLDTPSDAEYTMHLTKQKGNVVIKDSGTLSTGKFSFSLKSRYTIKGGFEKLDEISQTNPMAMLSYIVINSLEFTIDNPKGFLRNMLYLSYKESIDEAHSKEEKAMINSEYLLSGDKLHSKNEFTAMLQESSSKKLKALATEDPSFNELLNKNGQFEKKLDAVLAGKSSHIDIKIDNPRELSLGDFFTIFMGYAMQQKLAAKPDITLSIK